MFYTPQRVNSLKEDKMDLKTAKLMGGTGAIVSLVGGIFEIIAFFSLPDELVKPEETQTSEGGA